MKWNKQYLLKVWILVSIIQNVEILNIKDLLLQNIDKSSSDQAKLIAIFLPLFKAIYWGYKLVGYKNSAWRKFFRKITVAREQCFHDEGL